MKNDIYVLDWDLTMKEENFEEVQKKLVNDIPFNSALRFGTFDDCIRAYISCEITYFGKNGMQFCSFDILEHARSFDESRLSEVCDTIANFFEDGSYIHFRDSEENVWKWIFKNGKRKVFKERVIFEEVQTKVEKTHVYDLDYQLNGTFTFRVMARTSEEAEVIGEQMVKDFYWTSSQGFCMLTDVAYSLDAAWCQD